MTRARRALRATLGLHKACDLSAARRLFLEVDVPLWAGGLRLAVMVLCPGPAFAAGLDGAALGAVWMLPFVGMLLSVALGPLVASRVWQHHVGKIAAFWSLAVLVPLAFEHGAGVTLDAALHVLCIEYLPFILLLFALYTIAGGIVVAGNLRGSAAVNTGLLALGTALASMIGTTGASMVMIRPLIRANDDRHHNAHVVVFFIFLVSNIGGALTPLGDPPLFLGFLRGVDFFWTAKNLATPTLFLTVALLVLFYALDTFWYRRDKTARLRTSDPTPPRKIYLRGTVNLLLIAALVATIAASGLWRPGITFAVRGVTLELQNVLRDAVTLGLALASLAFGSRRDRAANRFTWHPIAEVAKIFAGIFICIVPVTAALQAGSAGLFAPLLTLVSKPDGTPYNDAYFWLTGLLSSFLDNAPTYLVFFDLAGGDPQRLMGPLAGTLAAISMGAVFMGANTYLGNAPNFMVYAVARGERVRMPGFFGYMAWSGLILLPLFALVTLLFVD